MGKVYRFLEIELATELDEKLGLGAILKDDVDNNHWGRVYNKLENWLGLTLKERKGIDRDKLVELAISKVDAINPLQRPAISESLSLGIKHISTWRNSVKYTPKQIEWRMRSQ